MDPTIGMMERLVEAAGLSLDMHVLDGAPTLTWIALRSDAHNLDWTAARGLADWARQHPAAVEAMIADPPPATGALAIDNLIAATAETLADDAGLPAPPWCGRIPAVTEPWEAPGTPAMRRRWRENTPKRFAVRNVWCPANAIWRERDHAVERTPAHT